ncbi:hypothetical protein LPJ61_002025 [Coemansia biformis]|uniref:Uncharacterized protein n=1 Tax=Coemansia biformis TaxID=1286918 RepID=A0A9W8CZJ1_9FUNG|nr:hypothetical protein LPJ61_002025 [Coemansia biformis]
MVFETSQRASAAAKSQGYRELDRGAIGSFCEARAVGLAGGGPPAVEAVCVDACASNTVAVAGAHGVVWAAEFARDVRCAWWIDERAVGVLTAAELHGALELFVVNVSLQDGAATPPVNRVCLQIDQMVGGPRSTPPLRVAAQGLHVVCTVAAAGPDTEALWYWRLDRGSTHGAEGAASVAESGWVRCEHPALVALCWIGPGAGLAATRDGGFWFVLTPHVQTAELACNLRRLDMLPWRWQEAVVAADTLAPAHRGPMPSRPVLCLPGPTGMSFYRLDATSCAAALLVRRAFPAGWVWLCASTAAYVILSPCRHRATVCRMPSGEPLYTARLHPDASGDDVFQDGWMLGETFACALSTGTALFVLRPDL